MNRDLSIPNFGGEDDLLPAIAQDAESGRVLMLGWMNRAAFDETVRTSLAVYYSRSRRRLWKKGETSGHLQRVQQILVDCDADAILLKVHQLGAACHEGYASCFFRRLVEGDTDQREWTTDEPRIFDPNEVYNSAPEQETERKDHGV